VERKRENHTRSLGVHPKERGKVSLVTVKRKETFISARQTEERDGNLNAGTKGLQVGGIEVLQRECSLLANGHGASGERGKGEGRGGTRIVNEVGTARNIRQTLILTWEGVPHSSLTRMASDRSQSQGGSCREKSLVLKMRGKQRQKTKKVLQGGYDEIYDYRQNKRRRLGRAPIGVS